MTVCPNAWHDNSVVADAEVHAIVGHFRTSYAAAGTAAEQSLQHGSSLQSCCDCFFLDTENDQ